ncbi:uncharacterized protein LOC124936685 [Impatiens glandulifera]|uniref:uncharacterized protein LOC124936685 n=1 Tax=Impatiens glandulifera TaxID=253017 RepID=UPI001FB0FBD6|nr:uncharacterized protein LOC124936685 [Impatiens glandulifera]
MSFLVCPRTLHDHELTAQLFPLSFLCSFCGEKHKEVGMSYQCRTCSFWIHEQCYSLPLNITHGSHDMHPLQLCHLQGEDLPECLCGVCVELINVQLGFYVCKRCKYYIHSKCSTKKWDPPVIEEEEDQINDKLIQFPLPSSEVARNTLIQFIKNICQWKDDEEEEDNILIHGSHHHPLTLDFDLSMITDFSTSRGDYKVCNGCMLPLLMNDAPFYCCNQCDFFLHKWCAKLPPQLKHPDPDHTDPDPDPDTYTDTDIDTDTNTNTNTDTDTEHTLILHEKLDEYFGFFTCKGCQQIGNGFAYKCNKCRGYYLDVKCAALPSRVNYGTHKHPFRLKYGRTIGGCFSCSKTNFFVEVNNWTFFNSLRSTISTCYTSFTFGCDRCHFSIHPKCLILPKKIAHWYDEHALKLTDPDLFISNDNQGASEYHCESCEKKIDPERWMYNCFECDQWVHANCVRKMLGLFSKPIKFGGLYDSQLHKEHPLTCILPGEEFHCCNEQGLDICRTFGIGFECTECQIRFCLTCFISHVSLWSLHLQPVPTQPGFLPLFNNN